MMRMVVVDVCQSAWAGRPPEQQRGGFLGIVFYKTKNQQVGEVSANSQIAVKSVTHERIQHQQTVGHILLFFCGKYLLMGYR
jgi:hypothetical protein